jgi:acyl-homoserine lactone acylase PvdQ
VAERYARDLSPATRALLEAYAAGVNAYAAAHPDEVVKGAENARGEDIAAAFTLFSPLFWGFEGVLSQLVDQKSHPCGAPPAPASPQDRGSNAFTIAPSRSADGHTRLVVNSHQPWAGPVAWWQARLMTEDGWSMQGGLFPGTPLPLLGHNRDLGWAATVNNPDLADLYRLTTDAEHPEQYFFDGEWRAFDKRRIWLNVRFGPIVAPIPRTLRFSVHGPVFKTADGWIAVRYAGAGDIRAVEQYYRMGRAKSFEEWRSALDMRAIPSTNLVYADAKGRIAFFYNAATPERAPGHDWRGCVRGDTSDTIPNSIVPLDRIPHLIDPASGWIMSANSTPFDVTDPRFDPDPADYAPELGVETRMTNRARRALELLTPIERISGADLHRIKFDVAYSPRSEMARVVREILAMPAESGSQLAAAQNILRSWDRRASHDSRGAALALLAYQPIYDARRLSRPIPSPRETIGPAMEALLRASGRLDPPLGDVLRLRRGRYDLPLSGGPDVLRAISWSIDDDGKMRADFGDGLIIFADWAPDGTLTSRTIHQFGAALGRPASPHYDDQAPLFAREQLIERRCTHPTLDRRGPAERVCIWTAQPSLSNVNASGAP